MNRFARAYERALFPRRPLDGGGRGGAPDAFDLAVGAGWYRLVCALEALVDSVRRAGVRRAARAQRGCEPAGAATNCTL